MAADVVLVADVPGDYVISDDGTALLPWVMPPEIAIPRAWVDLRARRDARLAASDWTQLPDVDPARRGTWASYRQALRDLPAATDDPMAVIWPTPPEISE